MKQTQRFLMVRVLLISLFTACLGYAGDGRLSVRTLAVEGCEMPVWHTVSDGGTYTELKWPVEQPSPVILTTAGKELPLFSKAPNAEGVEEFKEIRKLTIPEEADEVLIVAWPVEDDEKFRLMVVVAGFKQASSHDWVAINTSKQVVTLRYGTNKEPVQLEPCEAKPFRIDAEHGNGDAVTAQTKVKDDWRTIYSTYWAAPEKQRSLILFYDKDNRVKLRRLIDILQPAE